MASVFGFIPPRPEVWGGGKKEEKDGCRKGRKGRRKERRKGRR